MLYQLSYARKVQAAGPRPALPITMSSRPLYAI